MSLVYLYAPKLKAMIEEIIVINMSGDSSVVKCNLSNYCLRFLKRHP